MDKMLKEGALDINMKEEQIKSTLEKYNWDKVVLNHIELYDKEI